MNDGNVAESASADRDPIVGGGVRDGSGSMAIPGASSFPFLRQIPSFTTTVGGEYFLMWQSHVWNGQESAFRFAALCMLGLVFLAQRE